MAVQDVDAELPTYLDAANTTPVTGPSAPQMVTHVLQMKDKHGHAWLTLQTRSKARSPENAPRYVQGDPIEGTIALDLKDEKDVKAITIQAFGELVTEYKRFVFVDASHEVWAQSHGDPRSPPEKAEGASPYHGKLSGKLTWPSTLLLPDTVELEEGGMKKQFRLPANAFMRYSRGAISYKIQVVVKYSSFLRPDHLLASDMVYVPFIQPTAASPLRQLAYEERAPIPAPDVDPDGWQAFRTVTFKGKIFGDRTVEVTYTLSLAKPLSYTRGTVIPLHLTVYSADTHALDLLSSPTAPLVRLRRIHVMNYDAGGANTIGNGGPLADVKPLAMMHFQPFVGYVNNAIWWSTPAAGSVEVRTLQGEVHLPANLGASAHLGLYKDTYDVAIFDPQAVGFTHHAKKDEPWHVVEVEIATVHAPGPRPIAYSPPTYEEEKKEHVQETRGTAFNHFKYDLQP